MEAEEVREAKRSLVERHGAWRGYNLRLADDVYTMSPGLVGAAELNIARVLQFVSDHAPKPLAQLRILDLGANEGGFTIELACHGAQVRSIEGRESHVAKATFAAQCLGLDKVEMTQGDIRDLNRDRDGGFDVVLCLGVLYHLPPDDVYPFLERVASVCDGFMLLETNISLARKLAVETAAGVLQGRLYGENPRHGGAALDSTPSFWPTRPSLLNLLAAAGFTSVAECLSPPVLATAELSDHATYLAVKGTPVTVRAAPHVNSLDPSTWRWPEALRPRPSPTNDRRAALVDRFRTRVGTGVAQRVRRKS
jgi:2-polyprenyl-3-methyl-5-hydroxy-6-metoxy-1,4-benzoquinol methylase